METERMDGEARLPEGVGSKQWATRIRRKAKELVRQLDMANIELAEVLYLIWDTPVDGDSKRGATYTQWGYKSFAEYAEGELGLKRRKAEYLRNIGAKLFTDLAGIDKELKEKLMSLGWTKVRVLTAVLKPRNVADWVAMAEKLSYPELTEAVRKYREKKAADKEKKEQDGAVGASNAEASGEEEDENDDDPLPETEDVKWQHFMLYKEQNNTVEAAIERAKELSGSEKKGHNLEMICTDFLATNDFKKSDDPEMKKRYLAKMEELLGLKLIAIDPKKEDLVYGLVNLAKFADAMKQQEGKDE
jgi:hypothetical protein